MVLLGTVELLIGIFFAIIIPLAVFFRTKKIIAMLEGVKEANLRACTLIECMAQENAQNLPEKISDLFTQRAKTNSLSDSRTLFDMLLYYSKDTDETLALRAKAALIMYALYRKEGGGGIGEMHRYITSLKDTPEVQEIKRQMEAIHAGETAKPKAAE